MGRNQNHGSSMNSMDKLGAIKNVGELWFTLLLMATNGETMVTITIEKWLHKANLRGVARLGRHHASLLGPLHCSAGERTVESGRAHHGSVSQGSEMYSMAVRHNEG